MTLHETVRNPQVFDINCLNTNLHNDVSNAIPNPQITMAPTSVLLRTVALVALTHRQHQNAIANPVVVTPEILKAFPVEEVLFPFSNRESPFPNTDIIDAFVGRLDLIIANNELNPDDIAGARPIAPNFIRYLNNPAGINPAPAWATVAGVAGGNIPTVVPNFINDLNSAIIFADLNDTILRTQTNEVLNPRVPAPNPDLDNLLFVDQLNAMHNIHKKLVRSNIDTIRNRDMFDNKTIVCSVPNSGGATTLSITATGNFGATLVSSWGAYSGNAREQNAFKRLMWSFNNTLGQEQAGALSVIKDAEILKDLYRLECMREPAALITNAMFLELATSQNVGYRGFEVQYNFNNIKNRMPMAPKGTVALTRSLWKRIIWGRKDNLPIYYKYDYDTNDENPRDLIKLENNLLFNYITWKAGIPDLHNTVAGGNNLFPSGGTINRAAQIILLKATGFIADAANHNLYTRTIAIEPYPVPSSGDNNINAMNTRYNANADPNRNIVITATFRADGATLRPEDIVITHFPLELINQLLFQWYQVDVQLPNIRIEINLTLT